MKLGSIELARTICEELMGELPDGEQYGSVDVAEILSAHVRNLEDHHVADTAHLRRQIGYIVAELQIAGDKRSTPEIVEAAAKACA